MMIHFMVKSIETHRLNNKPTREWFKLFVLTNIFGFVVNFTPYGRVSDKKCTNEYKYYKDLEKIYSMTLFVVGIVD